MSALHQTIRRTTPLFVAASLGVSVMAAAPTPEQAEFFENKIRPILSNECFKCHSADAKKIKGELRLDSHAAVLKGGESGPSIVPGKPDESLVIKAVRYKDEDTAMPPDKPAMVDWMDGRLKAAA